MGLFTKKIGPVFLKEESEASNYIEKLKKLSEEASDDIKKKIDEQIKVASYGVYGEQNIAFELKNSGMDMYILHDIFLAAGELTAQIDYIVITRKRTYIIECKNLIGDIEIDNKGNFIRTYEVNGKKKKEGIYSPITQNERHLNVLKTIRKESKGNSLTKMLFENNFENNYKSIVVLANPKTICNDKYAKKEVKDKVIRADQLIKYIKNMDAASNLGDSPEKHMYELANFYLDASLPNKSDYSRKYEEMLELASNKVEKTSVDQAAINELRNDELIAILKKFRLETSREEKIKPFYVFNDAQMNELIEKRPRTKEELLSVSGFGPVKVEKYGEQLIKLLSLV
ncbi:MAG: NERD domain-containing protein [Lachnospiraceae bacterium]|nr:NERD domain-containing protein [Lachnospiraceae bacterium]